MPTCSESYGQGWVGEYPNCSYDPSTPAGTGEEQTPFTGTVGSLGYGEELAGSSWEEDWQKFFDPYDPAREEMATRHAGIDVGQLGAAWGLQEEQLGEAWGLRGAQLGETLGLGREQLGESWRLQEGGLGEQWGGRRGELGAGARRGFQDVERMISGMTQRGRGLTFGGQRQRQAEEEVSGAYERAFGLGQSAYEQAIASGQSRYRQALEAGTMGYEQAMETGELGVQQATTDIYQGLESDIFGQRESWEEQNRATLNVLLGSGIWPGNNSSGNGSSCEDPGCLAAMQQCMDGPGQSSGGCESQFESCCANSTYTPPPGNGGDGGNGYTPPANTGAGSGAGTDEGTGDYGVRRYV